MAQALALHGGASSFAGRRSDYSGKADCLGKADYSGKFDAGKGKMQAKSQRVQMSTAPARSSPPPVKRSPQRAGRTPQPAMLSQSRGTDVVPRRVPIERSGSSAATKPQPEILYQKYFKSVGPRTYAAQLKKAANGNHFLVLTEGKRDEKTEDIRKTKLFVFSEDFGAFFRMLHETAKFIRENPVPEEIRQKRERFWAKQSSRPKPAEPFSRPPGDGVTTSRTGRASPSVRDGRDGRQLAKR